jgi:small subunit ribosomal protein S17
MTTSAEQSKAVEARGRPKFREGVVVSDKGVKTIIVAVVRKFQHPQYGKFVSKTKRYAVHDEKDEAREGDTVKISECRPLSKTKSWKLAQIVSRAEQ